MFRHILTGPLFLFSTSISLVIMVCSCNHLFFFSLLNYIENHHDGLFADGFKQEYVAFLTMKKNRNDIMNDKSSSIGQALTLHKAKEDAFEKQSAQVR